MPTDGTATDHTAAPYTDADVELVARAFHAMCGVPAGEPTQICRDDARVVLDALADAGRLAHDCERRCPFEDLWNDTDPKPDESLARLQAAFNDAVAELGERYAERDKLRADLARQIEETVEVATELAEVRTTLDEMTRAVKRLAAERDHAIRLYTDCAHCATTGTR